MRPPKDVQIEGTEKLLEHFSQRLMQSYEETYSLFRILRLLACAPDPMQQIRLVCTNVQQVLPFGWVAAVFRSDAHVVPELRGRVVLTGEVANEAAFEQELRRACESLRGNEWTKVLVVGRHELATMTGSEVVCDPITFDEHVVGLLVAGGKQTENGEIASPEMQFLDAVAEFIGTFHENAARFFEQRAMSIGTIEALTAAIDAKDPYTRGHSERVAALAKQIALAYGIDEAEAERIRTAGIVHDVGKIGVPERVLCKPGKLDDEEFALIKMHPEIGHRILKGVLLLDHTLPGVLHHHERFDGRGYPHKLAGEGIPLQARIIGLADTFDAMSSSRSYRPAMPREKVLAEIARCAGTQFDPSVVEAFKRIDLGEYDRLMTRQAASAETSQVRAAA
ncbi:MAG: HD-GYP domain-containing protein [Phycisphaerales bacterium]|nr:HD-GYP domain-containing protein [Phycisphaerales bacterium]